jgi:hypothetical protein
MGLAPPDAYGIACSPDGAPNGLSSRQVKSSPLSSDRARGAGDNGRGSFFGLSIGGYAMVSCSVSRRVTVRKGLYSE